MCQGTAFFDLWPCTWEQGLVIFHYDQQGGEGGESRTRTEETPPPPRGTSRDSQAPPTQNTQSRRMFRMLGC